jgi:hypothetical protein
MDAPDIWPFNSAFMISGICPDTGFDLPNIPLLPDTGTVSKIKK